MKTTLALLPKGFVVLDEAIYPLARGLLLEDGRVEVSFYREHFTLEDFSNVAMGLANLLELQIDANTADFNPLEELGL